MCVLAGFCSVGPIVSMLLTLSVELYVLVLAMLLMVVVDNVGGWAREEGKWDRKENIGFATGQCLPLNIWWNYH